MGAGVVAPLLLEGEFGLLATTGIALIARDSAVHFAIFGAAAGRYGTHLGERRTAAIGAWTVAIALAILSCGAVVSSLALVIAGMAISGGRQRLLAAPTWCFRRQHRRRDRPLG